MRFFKALIISLLVYTLFIWLFVTQFSNFEKLPTKLHNHVIKIDIRDIPVPIKPTASIVKAKVAEVIVPKKIVEKKPRIKRKPIVKKKPKKKVVKKKIIKKKKTIEKKKIIKKKIVKKKVVKKKIIVKKKPSKEKVYVPKKIIEKVVVQEEFFEEVVFEEVFEEAVVQEEFFEETFEEIVIPNKSKELEAFESEMVYIAEPMLKPQNVKPTPVSPWSYPSNKIRKLYGAGFHNFTPTQKKFIANNLNSIQEITQRTLTRRGYPEGAGRTGQQGTNVVSFNLHPNGNISNLRLKTRIGYRALDDNTLSLIRVAYMDYPYPSTTTKIIFYVTYSIYGY